jgi:leucine efflux protein
MTNINWIEFIIASTGIVLLPGPSSMFIARTAAASLGASRLALLGIMIGDTCCILLSLLGVSALLAAYPSLFHAIRLTGAGYLIFLGLQSIFTAPEKQAQGIRDSILTFKRAVVIPLLNPKSVFFFMVFFPFFLKSSHGGMLIPYAAMTVAYMIISASYLLTLGYISSKIGLAFQGNRKLKLIFRKLYGSVFIGFGLKVAISSR